MSNKIGSIGGIRPSFTVPPKATSTVGRLIVGSSGSSDRNYDDPLLILVLDVGWYYGYCVREYLITYFIYLLPFEISACTSTSKSVILPRLYPQPKQLLFTYTSFSLLFRYDTSFSRSTVNREIIRKFSSQCWEEKRNRGGRDKSVKKRA